MSINYTLQADSHKVTLINVNIPDDKDNTEFVLAKTPNGVLQTTAVSTGAADPEPITVEFYRGENPADPTDKKNLEAMQAWRKEGSTQDKRKNISIILNVDGKPTDTYAFSGAYCSGITYPSDTKGQNANILVYTATIHHNGKTEGAK